MPGELGAFDRDSTRTTTTSGTTMIAKITSMTISSGKPTPPISAA